MDRIYVNKLKKILNKNLMYVSLEEESIGIPSKSKDSDVVQIDIEYELSILINGYRLRVMLDGKLDHSFYNSCDKRDLYRLNFRLVKNIVDSVPNNVVGW